MSRSASAFVSERAALGEADDEEDFFRRGGFIYRADLILPDTLRSTAQSMPQQDTVVKR